MLMLIYGRNTKDRVRVLEAQVNDLYQVLEYAIILFV